MPYKMNIIQIFLFFCLHMSFSLYSYAVEEDDEGKRDYFEDNFQPDAYEILPYEFDQRNTYWPRELNESRFIVEGKVYIYGWEQDPPNSFWIFIYDSRSQIYTESEVDIKIVTGIWDENRNVMPDNRLTVTAKIKPGWNKVMINVHHYKAQIIAAGLTGLRTKSRIKTLEFKDKT